MVKRVMVYRPWRLRLRLAWAALGGQRLVWVTVATPVLNTAGEVMVMREHIVAGLEVKSR